MNLPRDKTAKSSIFGFLLAVFLVSCGGGSTSDAGGTLPVISVTSPISTTTIWQAGNVYLVDNLWIQSTLVIQPGVIVKFKVGGAIQVTGLGRVSAVGTTSKPIVFTSVKDDTKGGVTDGNALSPNVGDWNEIVLNANGSAFENCEFYYGGGGAAYNSTLRFGLDSHGPFNATITNSTFAHNDGGHFSGTFWNVRGALDAFEAASGTVISGNTFYANNIPLGIGPRFSLDDSNVFHDPAHSTVTNTYNGIYLLGPNYGYFNDQITLSETEVPFVLQGAGLGLPSGSTLTLGAGVVFKFSGTDTQFYLGGTLALPAGNLVTFTSLKDDALLGDTNGDGASSSGAAGDWLGVRGDFGNWYHPANLVISYSAN